MFGSRFASVQRLNYFRWTYANISSTPTISAKNRTNRTMHGLALPSGRTHQAPTVCFALAVIQHPHENKYGTLFAKVQFLSHLKYIRMHQVAKAQLPFTPKIYSHASMSLLRYVLVQEIGGRGWWLPGGGVDKTDVFPEAAGKKIYTKRGKWEWL